MMYIEQVAECGEDGEIVGIIRGCIKTVTRGNKGSTPCPVYVKIAYILGLRVSSQHRYDTTSSPSSCSKLYTSSILKYS